MGNVLRRGSSLLAGDGTQRIRLGNNTLAVRNQEMLAIRRDADRGGIPADGNITEGAAFAGFTDIDDRNHVVVRIGDEKNFFIRSESQAVGSGAGRHLRMEGSPDGFDGPSLFRIE